MRDKTMRDKSKQRANLPPRLRGRRLTLSFARTLSAIGLLMRLMVLTPAFDARELNQIQPQASGPDVQITHVNALPALGDKATTHVEVKWTAQVPRLTTIDDFEVVLEVRYSDGSKGAARNQQLKPSARAAVLAMASHPRPNSAATLQAFKAAVSVRFRIASSFALVQQIAAQSNIARPSQPSPSATQPEVFITAAKLLSQGCSAGQRCVDVKWTAAAPRNIEIADFTAGVEASHADGTKTKDSKTVSNQERQARLQAGPANVEVNSMTVSLRTSFFLLDSRTAVKEGTFSFDNLRG